MARRLGTRGRFGVAYLLLAAAVGAGIGTFIVLLQRPGPAPPPPWSSWRPNGASRNDQMREIAQYVGDSYRLLSGDRLALIRVGLPRTEDSFREIAVFSTTNLADFTGYDESKSVIYTVCGLGPSCSIGGGDPATDVGTVLRRQALELALYSFEYEDGIDNVLVLLPPDQGQSKVKATLFFHRDDFSSQLDEPLRRTLPQREPPLPGQIAPNEQQTVDQLTMANVYGYVGPVRNGSLLALRPPG